MGFQDTRGRQRSEINHERDVARVDIRLLLRPVCQKVAGAAAGRRFEELAEELMPWIEGRGK